MVSLSCCMQSIIAQQDRTDPHRYCIGYGPSGYVSAGAQFRRLHHSSRPCNPPRPLDTVTPGLPVVVGSAGSLEPISGLSASVCNESENLVTPVD